MENEENNLPAVVFDLVEPNVLKVKMSKQITYTNSGPSVEHP